MVNLKDQILPRNITNIDANGSIDFRRMMVLL